MAEEASVTVVPAEGGTWLSWLGHPVRYMALGAQTGETFAFGWGPPLPASLPPPHRHTFDEGFYVLKGAVRFTAGDRSTTLPEGGFINIQGGTAHTLTNDGPGEAEVLVLTAPAGFDRFQIEVGHPVADSSGPFLPPTEDDHRRLLTLGPGYGIEFDLPEDAFRSAPKITARRPGEGRSVAVVGDLYTFLVDGDDTSGRYALWHALIPPGGGPPPHIQTREYEGFYVLEGEISFFTADARVVAGPGTFVNVPPGAVHAFRNETDRPARQLIWVAPAGLEKMFTEFGTIVTDLSAPIPPTDPATIAKLLAIAPTYGVEIRPPGDH